MAVEITHIRFGSTEKTESTIVLYRWRNPSDGNTGDSDKPTMVDWISNKNGKAFVGSGTQRVEVGVVRPSGGQPYLRTYADGDWTNNLLSLPEF